MSSVRQTTPVLGGLSFGESPRWHDGRLYVSDTFASRIVVVDDGVVETVFDGGGPVLGGVGWLADGTMLVGEMNTRRIVAVAPDGVTRPYADCSAYADHWINDLIVHPDGFAYVSQMGFDFAAVDFDALRGDDPMNAPPSALIRVDPDGSVHEAASDLSFSNNMALSGDGRMLFVAETGTRKVTAFTVGPAGELSERRVFVDLSKHHNPDGLCVDAEGALWVALPETSTFLRLREGGEIVDEIVLGEDRIAVACVLGGDDRRTLYLVHADRSGPAELMERKDSRVDKVTVPTAGVGLP